jgi:2-dehydro-3-deoxygluconokinase
MTAGGGVVTFGETMALFRSTSLGGIDLVSDFQLGIGGAESNVAVGLARLGTPVTWVGRVGSDSLGRRITRELRAEGIDVRAIVDEAAATGLMIKEQRTSEATRVLYYRAGSAGSRLAPEDVAGVDIGKAEILHLTGITPALSESSAAAVDAAIDVAVAAGVAVSFDVNHRAALWAGRDASPVYRAVAARSTIVFAGEHEAGLLVPDAGGSNDDQPLALARAISDLGPREVIIKRGDLGAFALVDGVAFAREAISIRAVDTVGAGDAFVAGYLSERLAGLAVTERLATAVRTGAFACLSHGDWEGYPRRDELGLLEAIDPVTR